MSRIPVLAYLGPLNMVISRKSMQLFDTSAVYCMLPILLLQWATRLCISTGVLSMMTKMSSMNLSQTSGCVPSRDEIASSSTFALNRLASVGATGVPITTPFSCLKCFPAKQNLFSLMTIVSRSFSIFFMLFSLDAGGFVGIACCKAMLIPKVCGMDGYRLTTSMVASVSSLYLLGGKTSCSIAVTR